MHSLSTASELSPVAVRPTQSNRRQTDRPQTFHATHRKAERSGSVGSRPIVTDTSRPITTPLSEGTGDQLDRLARSRWTPYQAVIRGGGRTGPVACGRGARDPVTTLGAAIRRHVRPRCVSARPKPEGTGARSDLGSNPGVWGWLEAAQARSVSPFGPSGLRRASRYPKTKAIRLPNGTYHGHATFSWIGLPAASKPWSQYP
jgi:hypothetical protein